MALSLVLLVGALLFVRSLHNLLTTDAGFKAIILRSAVTESTGDCSRPSLSAWVWSVRQGWFTPVVVLGCDDDIGPDGSTAAASGKQVWFNRASPGYFKTMGIGVIAGREFTERDNLSSPKVAIVNETFVER